VKKGNGSDLSEGLGKCQTHLERELLRRKRGGRVLAFVDGGARGDGARGKEKPKIPSTARLGPEKVRGQLERVFRSRERQRKEETWSGEA